MPWEKKEDLSAPQAGVLLQLSTAAVTEVMQEPATRCLATSNTK